MCVRLYKKHRGGGGESYDSETSFPRRLMVVMRRKLMKVTLYKCQSVMHRTQIKPVPTVGLFFCLGSS